MFLTFAKSWPDVSYKNIFYLKKRAYIMLINIH